MKKWRLFNGRINSLELSLRLVTETWKATGTLCVTYVKKAELDKSEGGLTMWGVGLNKWGGEIEEMGGGGGWSKTGVGQKRRRRGSDSYFELVSYFDSICILIEIIVFVLTIIFSDHYFDLNILNILNFYFFTCSIYL